MDKAVLGVLALFLISSAFAIPEIDYLKVTPAYPDQIQISWKAVSENGVTKAELFMDGELIYEEEASGTTYISLYQVSDDNQTHKFQIVIYDFDNSTATKSKNIGGDDQPPKVLTQNVISMMKTFTFETDEEALCKAGLFKNDMNFTSKNYQREHSINLNAKEGDNDVFIICVDKEENEMPNLITANFVLDNTMPTQVTNINHSRMGENIKLTWNPSKDNSGIANYNIYNTLELIEITRVTEWIVTADDDNFYISAVDGAGNEGKRTEYNLGRKLLLEPTIEQTTEEEAAEEESEETEVSTTAIIALIVLGVLIGVFASWKIYEKKTDAHGLRKYLKERRLMRDRQ